MSNFPPDVVYTERQLKNRIMKKCKRNANELWSATSGEWNSILIKRIENFYKSIPREIIMTLRNKGLHYCYK